MLVLRNIKSILFRERNDRMQIIPVGVCEKKKQLYLFDTMLVSQHEYKIYKFPTLR